MPLHDVTISPGAVFYNTARKSRGKFFKVDRIAEKRKFVRVSNNFFFIRADGTKVIRHLIEYLVCSASVKLKSVKYNR